ncbi:MAG: hypothetical protein ACK4XM_12750 [Chloroherpetonaceae bacterium]
MTIKEIEELLIETLKDELPLLGVSVESNTVRSYDGRFDDEALANQIVAKDKVIMVDVEELRFDVRESSEDVYITNYSASVSIFVGLATVTERGSTHYEAIDVCRRVLQVLFKKSPQITELDDVRTSLRRMMPSRTGAIQKVFQTTSGYTVARLDVEFKLLETWK